MLPNTLIYSFEPVKSTFKKLKENVRNKNNIIPIEKGLYTNNCTKEINIFPSDTHSSLFDIEGAKYDALIGFEKHIKSGKIKMIQFEYGYINITTKKLLEDFYNYFESKGYVLGKIFPKTVEFRKYEFKYQ